jgi:hypothetical protein
VRRPLRAALATVVVLAAVACADATLALELLPAVLLVALAVVGWMPGEDRLVRAMRRRRAAPRVRRPIVAARPIPRVPVLRGRLGASAVALRGPPSVLAA